jgi:hypothetical protein
MMRHMVDMAMPEPGHLRADLAGAAHALDTKYSAA